MALDIGGGFRRWQILVIIGLLGLALIIVPHLIDRIPSWIGSISEGTGIALLSSAVLGATIERWLRSDLSKDIFLTAIGHHLPSEYRECGRSCSRMLR
jgi:hypothetical protein